MDASVANRMRVKRSVRTSQPVRCNLRRSASVTLQYRAFNCTRHPERSRGIPWRDLYGNFTSPLIRNLQANLAGIPLLSLGMTEEGIFLTLCKRPLSFNS